ncbi:MAG TPA: hypothetical protein VFY89_09800 [Ktedonobacterales bacterium]
MNMSNTSQASMSEPARRKKPLDPHLLISDRGTVDDVRVQSGYPIWNLVGDWMGHHYDDDAVVADYGISREEWAAAKQYYLDHKIFFDARIITNSQPNADDDTPPLRTTEEYFAWLGQQESEEGTRETGK